MLIWSKNHWGHWYHYAWILNWIWTLFCYQKGLTGKPYLVRRFSEHLLLCESLLICSRGPYRSEIPWISLIAQFNWQKSRNLRLLGLVELLLITFASRPQTCYTQVIYPSFPQEHQGASQLSQPWGPVVPPPCNAFAIFCKKLLIINKVWLSRLNYDVGYKCSNCFVTITKLSSVCGKKFYSHVCILGGLVKLVFKSVLVVSILLLVFSIIIIDF